MVLRELGSNSNNRNLIIKNNHSARYYLGCVERRHWGSSSRIHISAQLKQRGIAEPGDRSGNASSWSDTGFRVSKVAKQSSRDQICTDSAAARLFRQSSRPRFLPGSAVYGKGRCRQRDS